MFLINLIANGGIIGIILGILILAGLVYLALQWRRLQRAVVFALLLVPAVVIWLVGVIAIPLWKPVGWLTDRLLGLIPLNRRFQGVLTGRRRRWRAALLAGDRQTHAHVVWPPAIYPELYQAVPDDLYRPPYEDGRLLGGVPIAWLADRHLTDMAVRSAVRAGIKAGVLVFVLAAILMLVGTLLTILDFFPALFRGERPVLERWPGEDPIQASAWSMVGANIGHAFAHLLANIAALLVYVPAAAAMSLGATILITLILLRVWMRQKSAPYELVTKDAEVRWPYRIETRNLLRRTYRQQIKLATERLAGQPTFRVGTASGTLRVRGDLAAPLAGQPLLLDSESLFQHTLVLGGTGEGKTTAILKPLLRQVLADPRFGMFLADAKGVLWSDAARIAEQLGRSGDVLVIGTGPGQLGVDVTAGLNPAQIAAALRSVLVQMGGGGGKESFWPDMASTVLRHMLTIGRGYAETEAGKEEAAKGLHPYSLWWAYQAVLRPDFADMAVASRCDAHANAGGCRRGGL